MTPDLLPIVGAVLAAALGGGTVTGVLNYRRDRRKDRTQAQGDAVTVTFATLQEMNGLLHAEIVRLNGVVDTERARGRELEQAMQEERRQRWALEARIAELERRAGPEEET